MFSYKRPSERQGPTSKNIDLLHEFQTLDSLNISGFSVLEVNN